MIDQNYSFNALNSANAALSLVIHIPEEQKPLLKFFLKGAFNKNPPKPKYKFMHLGCFHYVEFP